MRKSQMIMSLVNDKIKPSTKQSLHWSVFPIVAGIVDVFLSLISPPISILLISIVGWLVYMFIYSKRLNLRRELLLFSSLIMSAIVYLGLVFTCRISSVWVCERNLFIPSLFVSLIPIWGWIIILLSKVLFRAKS